MKKLTKNINSYTTMVKHSDQIKGSLFLNSGLIQVLDPESKTYILVTNREYNDMIERRCF